MLVGSGEDGLEITSDLFFQMLFGDVGLGIVLQVELAALPGDAGEACFPRRLESGVIVGDDELGAMKPAILQLAHEASPMYFGL